MKLFVNKFFLITVFVITALFIVQFYFISISYKRDTNTYVTLVKWAWTLTSESSKRILKTNDKKVVKKWDIIYTLKNSLAVIEWWDKSVTRLWENTKVIVKENSVSEDIENINISFELLMWKTWSNVVSIMTWKSKFNQEVKWTVAAVRGTVFEVDYEKDFVKVYKHEVKLINSNSWTLNILPWDTFSISNFSIDNVKKVFDDSFEKLNQSMDKQYIIKLREDLIKRIDENWSYTKYFNDEAMLYSLLQKKSNLDELNSYLLSLSEEKKQIVLKKLELINQSVNFENWENSELYNLKIKVREALLNNTNNAELKEKLLRYSLYDLNEMLSLWNFKQDLIDSTVNLLWLKKDFLESLKEKLNSKDNSYQLINQILNQNWGVIYWNWVVETFKNIDEKWNEIIQSGLNKLLEIYKK